MKSMFFNQNQEPRSIYWIAFLAFLLVALVWNKNCNAQCADTLSHENPFSQFVEDPDYHCFKASTQQGILTCWDFNQDSIVNTGDQLSLLSFYKSNGLVRTAELNDFLSQYSYQVEQRDCPNLCLFSVTAIQSSGMRLVVPDQYTDQIFDHREGLEYPYTEEDAIIAYSANDEGANWPDCLSSEVLCLQTFKLTLFVKTDPLQLFPIVEEYYYLKN